MNISLLNHIQIYTKWKNQIKKDQKPYEAQLPWITIASFEKIIGYLNGLKLQDIRIFEYGSGGSSYFFLNHADIVVSVEHDKLWYSQLKNYSKNGHFGHWDYRLIPPDQMESSPAINALNPINYSSDQNPYQNLSFKKYVTSIEDYPDEYFDLVLIDGRSRVSCLFHAQNKVKKGGWIVLDNAERDRYFKFETLNTAQFELIFNHYGALICTPSYVQTNIYLKKK